MEQSVIRVSSFTHAVASATPHATFLDSASLHPGYNSKAHPHAPYFRKRHEHTKDSDIYSLKLGELRGFVVTPLFCAPFALFLVAARSRARLSVVNKSE
jgi:hypothetical protein